MCRHSTMVVASMKYPAQRTQVRCALRSPSRGRPPSRFLSDGPIINDVMMTQSARREGSLLTTAGRRGQSHRETTREKSAIKGIVICHSSRMCREKRQNIGRWVAGVISDPMTRSVSRRRVERGVVKLQACDCETAVKLWCREEVAQKSW